MRTPLPRFAATLALVACTMAYGIDEGETAPDFTLTDTEGQEHSLSDYDGEVVVLFFLGCT